MSAAEHDPQQKVNRRTLLKAAALAATSVPLLYDGFSRLAEADAQGKEEIARMPKPGYTADEVKAAKIEVAQGYEYLGNLVNNIPEETIVDLGSSSFATSEAIVRSQTSYDRKVESIENDPDNLGMAEVVGGIILGGGAIATIGHFHLDKHSHTATEVPQQE